MDRGATQVLAFGIGIVVITLLSVSSHAEVLITAEEAHLPSTDLKQRAIFLGPTIEVLSPHTNGDSLKSPLHLNIRFQNHGGAKVDLDTLSVTYLKKPTVDLTARILPFAKADGINMPVAEVPPGNHLIWIEVMDTNGNSGWTQLLLNVAK